jgi:hypothetical protein
MTKKSGVVVHSLTFLKYPQNILAGNSFFYFHAITVIIFFVRK